MLGLAVALGPALLGVVVVCITFVRVWTFAKALIS